MSRDRAELSALLPIVEVDALRLWRVAMPLVRPFRTSFGLQTERDVLLVEAVGGGVSGWGECVTPAAPVYSSEYTDGAVGVLADHLAPCLWHASALDPTDLPALLAPVRGHRMAKAALEMAVLDLALRRSERSLAAHLGAVRERVPCGVSVGIPDGRDDTERITQLLDQVAGHLDEGYLRIKLKVAPGFDLAPVRAVRDAFGAGLRLQVDANAAYVPEDAGVFDALDELGLELIEQPLAEERLLDHARLAERLTTPVCLDETLVDATVTADALDLRACEIVNLKLGRVGGITESLRIHALCHERDVPLWCGGMLETGIGRAVNVALAAMPGFTLPGDTSASARYWAEDLTEPFVLDAGHLPAPTGPGIGVSPDPDRLAAWTTDTSILRAAG